MKKIKGIIPPMVTPLLDGSHIDTEGAKRIADNMIDAGVSAIFLLGTTGESQSIAMHLRFEFVAMMCRHIAGRVPVLVAVTETSMEDSIKMAEHAAACGATAVVSAPPYYFPANQGELVDWYTALADACPLPVFLYNMPSKVKVFLEVPTVVALSGHPNIAGLKDSSGDMQYFKKIAGIFKDSDFAIYMGPEEMTAEAVKAGADGGVNGGANLFPSLFVEMYRTAAAGEDTADVQSRIMYLSENLYHLDPYSDASFLRGLKCALGASGRCSGFVALPYKPFEGALKERAEAVYADLVSKGYR